MSKAVVRRIVSTITQGQRELKNASGAVGLSSVIEKNTGII